ncbi:hypothetical protein [Corynebacterium propinquum]
MVSDGAMTLKEELTQPNPLQEALQYSQKTITERHLWRAFPKTISIRVQIYYSCAMLEFLSMIFFSISQRVDSARTVMPSGISCLIWKKTIVL